MYKARLRGGQFVALKAATERAAKAEAGRLFADAWQSVQLAVAQDNDGFRVIAEKSGNRWSKY